MDRSSAQAGTGETASEAGPEPRPTKLGFRLIFAGFAVMIGLLALGLLLFFRDLSTLHSVGAGRSEAIELDEGTYLIYEEYSSRRSDIAVVGDSGPVRLRDVSTTTKIDINDFHARATHSIEIDSSGMYEVKNNGDGQVAIGRPFAARIIGLILGPILIGGLIIGIGAFLIFREQPLEPGPQDDLSSVDDA